MHTREACILFKTLPDQIDEGTTCAHLITFMAGSGDMVKLNDVAEVLDSSNSTVRFYYDRKEDEVVCIIDAFLPAQKSLLKKVEADNGAKYVMVDPVENIGYAAMQAFEAAQPEGDLKTRLSEAVAAGGMRRFRNVVEDSGVLEEWKGFRQRFLESEARKWCETHDVPISE